MNLIAGRRNDNVSVCICGHHEEAHNGHTHAVGSEEPHHCSQGCGCKYYQQKVPFLDPGDYGKLDGIWYCIPPGNEKLLGCLRGHKVVEHEDGTITVSPSILISYEGGDGNWSWHGFLERGVWRDS